MGGGKGIFSATALALSRSLVGGFVLVGFSFFWGEGLKRLVVCCNVGVVFVTAVVTCLFRGFTWFAIFCYSFATFLCLMVVGLWSLVKHSTVQGVVFLSLVYLAKEVRGSKGKTTENKQPPKKQTRKHIPVHPPTGGFRWFFNR